MSDHQKHREAMSRKCLEAMSAKGLTFKSLAATIQLSPFITAAAMLGQMPVPQDVASKASDVLSLPEANEFLTEIPIRGSLGATVPSIRPYIAFMKSFRSMGRRSRQRRAQINAERHVRFWHLADIDADSEHVRYWRVKRTWLVRALMAAYDPNRTSLTALTLGQLMV